MSLLAEGGMTQKQSIIFPIEYIDAKRNQRYELKKDHKDLLDYYIRLALEKEPMLSANQVKSKGVQNFLLDAHIDVLCVDTYRDNEYGILIVDRISKKELGFIKNSSVLINVIYDFYFSGKLAASGGPKAAIEQGIFGF